MSVILRPGNGVSHGLKYVIPTSSVDVAEVVTLVVTHIPSADGNVSVTLPSLPIVAIAVDDGVAEKDTLTITAPVSTAGNVTVTLPELAGVVVPVVDARAEVVRINITAGATASSDIGITLPDLAEVNIPVTALDDANTVATKIRAGAFTGWTASGADAQVLFTQDVPTEAPGAAGMDLGTTGVTGDITSIVVGRSADTAVGVATKIRAETYTGWTTGGADAVVTFTKNVKEAVTGAPAVGFAATGVTGAFVVTNAGVDADTINEVATKIRAGTFTGWTTGGTDATVTFTKDVIGAVAGTPVVGFASTGVTGTIEITAVGADNAVTFDFRSGDSYPMWLVACVTITDADGTINNPANLKVTYPAKGVVEVNGTLVATKVIHLVAQRDCLNS